MYKTQRSQAAEILTSMGVNLTQQNLDMKFCIGPFFNRSDRTFVPNIELLWFNVTHSQFEVKFIDEHDVLKPVKEIKTNACGHDGINTFDTTVYAQYSSLQKAYYSRA